MESQGMITDAQVDLFQNAFHHRLNLGAVPGETPGERWREAVREGLEAAESIKNEPGVANGPGGGWA